METEAWSENHHALTSAPEDRPQNENTLVLADQDSRARKGLL